MNNKKAQADGGAVYILILLMAFFILIYVILLPPGEREELLNITSSTDAATGEAPAKTVVLSESPGKIYSFTSNLQTINIEPIHVYSRDESASFTLIKSMTVSRNILKDNLKTVFFDLADIAELKDVKLFFLITESKGPITIYLNGKLLYEGLLTSSQMPLELPLINLQEKNKLEFFSSSLGWRIFSSNYYIMQDVQLIKTLKVEKTQATRTFFVSEDIGDKLSRATLTYFVTCNKISENPMLTISLNSREIFKDTVFCEYLEERSVPLTRTSLNAYGRNKLDVSIDKGDINVDELKVKAELNKAVFPTYTFDISSDLWAKLQSGSSKLYLKMKFPDTSHKRAKLYVQGELFNMDTSSTSYEKDISKMIDNGANSLKIEPSNNFEILNLKIVEQ
ncbi:MAG: hypothetical protein V1906_00315 [Candidatus Woesearchaeota archaeon]